MERDLSLLKRNIARLRRDIRIQSREMQTLIDRDLDCTGAARVLMHMQSDLRLFLDKQERLHERLVQERLAQEEAGRASIAQERITQERTVASRLA